VLKYVAKRLGLALLTVFVVTTAIFFMTNVLPGDPATRILGNLAEPENVAKLRKDLGLDRPLLAQYWTWLSNTLQGDLGNSIQHRVPVVDYILPAIGLSLRLAAIAFLLTVPLSIIGGITAGVMRGKPVDRVITVGGLSAAVVPEFVWAVLLVLIVGVRLKWLPTSAYPGPDEAPLTYVYHLILPSIALVLVLFGYISRIARAGVIEAFDSDYVRTATLKGLPRRKVVNKHVLRNALLPSIAVVASQVPYLIGGLVAVERVFNYPGFGTILIKAVQYRDYPVLQSSVLIVAVVIVLAQLIADILFALLNPRIRQGIER
jgi:peptide/nickel transport system permease protein